MSTPSVFTRPYQCKYTGEPAVKAIVFDAGCSFIPVSKDHVGVALAYVRNTLNYGEPDVIVDLPYGVAKDAPQSTLPMVVLSPHDSAEVQKAYGIVGLIPVEARDGEDDEP